MASWGNTPGILFQSKWWERFEEENMEECFISCWRCMRHVTKIIKLLSAYWSKNQARDFDFHGERSGGFVSGCTDYLWTLDHFIQERILHSTIASCLLPWCLPSMASISSQGLLHGSESILSSKAVLPPKDYLLIPISLRTLSIWWTSLTPS